MISKTQRTLLRAKIGTAILGVQQEYQRKYEPGQIVPEMIAALVSLAAMIAKDNADLGPEAFRLICAEAARERWGIEAKPAE